MSPRPNPRPPSRIQSTEKIIKVKSQYAKTAANRSDSRNYYNELTETDIRQLLTYGYTSPIYGFIGNQGRKFCDALVLDAKFRVTFAAKAAKIYS